MYMGDTETHFITRPVVESAFKASNAVRPAAQALFKRLKPPQPVEYNAIRPGYVMV